MATFTKKNPKTISVVLKAISHGLSENNASKLAGITQQTWIDWKKVDNSINIKIEAVRNKALERNLKVIENAGNRSWQAAAWWVERTRPEEYSPKLTQDITSNQPVVVNVDMQGTYKPPVPGVTQPQEKTSHKVTLGN